MQKPFLLTGIVSCLLHSLVDSAIPVSLPGISYAHHLASVAPAILCRKSETALQQLGAIYKISWYDDEPFVNPKHAWGPEDRKNPLCKAVLDTSEASTQRITELIIAGTDVNYQTSDGSTPLMVAIVFHNSEIVKLLLSAGAKADQQTSNGTTCLIKAINNLGDLEIMQALIAAGANVNHQASNGETPLICAIQPMAWTFSFRGLCITIPQACLPDPLEMIKFLLAAGADVNHPDGDGYTPLSTAIRFQNPEIIKILLTAGADVNHPDGDGYIPLFTAIRFHNPEIIKILLDANADVNQQAFRQTALRYVMAITNSETAAKDCKIVKLLLAAGADISRQPYCCDVLDQSFFPDRLKMITSLLAAGAWPTKEQYKRFSHEQQKIVAERCTAVQAWLLSLEHTHNLPRDLSKLIGTFTDLQDITTLLDHDDTQASSQTRSCNIL